MNMLKIWTRSCQSSKYWNLNISNIDSLDSAVGETYRGRKQIFTITWTTTASALIHFYGIVLPTTHTNWLNVISRLTVVACHRTNGMQCNFKHLPSQYSVEDAPAKRILRYAEPGWPFLTSFESDNNTFTFSYVTQLNRSVYHLKSTHTERTF